MKRSWMMLMAASLFGFAACEQQPAQEVQQVPEVQEMPEAEPMTPPPAAPMDTMQMQQPTDTMPMQ
ncbi:MAG TPA: hypothetical protein VF158_05935 [Longimicrobiales bacterium]